MSSLALINAKILLAGYDFSAQANALALEYAAEMIDATTFGQTTRINKGGLKSIVGSVAGHWDASATNSVDPVLFARVGGADQPVILSPDGGEVGERAYLFRAIHSEYSLGGELGGLLPFDLKMEGAGGQPLIQGAMLFNGSATGDAGGTPVELGALGTGQYLYGALEVFSGTGNFTVRVQSDTVQTFDDDPTERILFTQVGTGVPIAAEWAARVAGPIADHTWWRVAITNPNTRNFAVAIGFQ
jgi:hypothetical protein